MLHRNVSDDEDVFKEKMSLVIGCSHSRAINIKLLKGPFGHTVHKTFGSDQDICATYFGFAHFALVS